MRTLVLSMAVGWLIASTAIAGEACKAPPACGEVQTCGGPQCCAHCGCQCCCQKYCQVICEMKEIKKYCWVVHCEEFCAPLPGCPRNCDPCEACECHERCCKEGRGCKKCCDPCAIEESKRRVPPKCGNVRQRKTLEKVERICKVPCYKCIVIYCCPHCDGQFNAAPARSSATPTPAPPPPPKTTENAPMPPPAPIASTLP